MQISHWLQRSTKTYTQNTVLSIKGLIKKKKKKKKYQDGRSSKVTGEVALPGGGFLVAVARLSCPTDLCQISGGS